MRSFPLHTHTYIIHLGCSQSRANCRLRATVATAATAAAALENEKVAFAAPSLGNQVLHVLQKCACTEQR